MTEGQHEQYGKGEDPASLVEERHTIRSAEPRLDSRRGFLASDGLLILLGIWLMASPFVLSYGSGDERWLPVVSGVLITVVALAALAGIVPRFAAAWTVIGVAAFLFIGGLPLSDSSEASWNAMAGGALVAFLAIMAAASSAERPQ